MAGEVGGGGEEITITIIGWVFIAVALPVWLQHLRFLSIPKVLFCKVFFLQNAQAKESSDGAGLACVFWTHV